MVPAHSPESQPMKKPPQPNRSNNNMFKSLLNSIRTHLTSYPRFWLFIAFLWIQAIIISIARTPTPCFPDRTSLQQYNPQSTQCNNPQNPVVSRSDLQNTTKPEPESESGPYTDDCPSGKVFIYDLPPIFNKDLILHNCTDIDIWNWECGIITNHGYGAAAAELRPVLPDGLHKSWYRTNQFTSEVIFHYRVLKHKCRTIDPEKATGFYIPFYVGLAVGKHLWGNDTGLRDRHCKMMLKWVKKQGYWSKLNGSDHFMTIGRITWDFRRLTDPGEAWGSSFLNLPSMQKVTRFIIEKAHGDEMDVTVPYPIGFHPKTVDSLNEWQGFVRNVTRTSLFTFVGTRREGDFRGVLFDYCGKESGSCLLVDCAASQCAIDLSVSVKAHLASEFCLQPKGDSFTRKAVIECMVGGSVPVFFWKRTAYEQYEWFLPGEPESYSVFIDHESVMNGTSIKDVLKRYSKEDIRKKREKVIETIPRLIYAKPNGGFRSFNDAFDVAFDGVMERIKEEKEWSDFL